MAVETQYNIVKVNELREVTSVTGTDELIINDTDSSPLETKKVKVEQFALDIKDYILPIATDTLLGGVKIGNGLTINPITGVLSNDINILDDLQGDLNYLVMNAKSQAEYERLILIFINSIIDSLKGSEECEGIEGSKREVKREGII